MSEESIPDVSSRKKDLPMGLAFHPALPPKLVRLWWLPSIDNSWSLSLCTIHLSDVSSPRATASIAALVNSSKSGVAVKA